MPAHRPAALFTLIGLLLAASNAAAQTWSAMAQAIPVVSRATPTADHESLTEGYLSQPLIMARGSLGWLTALTTLNFEGLTLKRGELTTGAYGEGYVDRRHPHTYVHELMVGAQHTVDGVRVSLFGGRGFVPFGSDDPMVRPLEKYPVNHHLSQLLERVVATGAVSYRALTIEGATFNGDEPTGPGAPPQFHRFGDSWAARGTWRPTSSLELAASTAHVKSPEIPTGGGLDHDKRNVVARYASADAPTTKYGMIEWARTVESTTGFQMAYRSVLSEGAYCRDGITGALRIEQTDRPEEDRTIDPFRTPRPATDLSTDGTTRWTIGSVALSTMVRRLGPLRAAPFIEVSAGHPHRLDPHAVFDPATFYGASTLWLASVGVRLRVGHMHDRMGRYGAALPGDDGGMAGMPGMKGMSGMSRMNAAGAPTKSSRCEE